MTDAQATRRHGISPAALSAAVLTLLGALVAWSSAGVLWMGDDVDYSFYIRDVIWNSQGTIDSPAEFFASQANHYLNVNGRYVAHVLVQLFCAVLGQNAFAVCNGLVYCVFVVLLTRLGGIRRPLKSPGALSAVAALTLCIFVTKMMPSTQIGFVWMFTLTMAWLLLTRRWRRTRTLWRLALLFVLSVVAGNGQEALNLGLSAALGLWWLSRRCRVPRAVLVALSGFWLGTLADCLSPATMTRAGGMHITLADSLLYLTLGAWALYPMAAVVLWQWLRRGRPLRGIYRRNSLWFNTIFILLIFNILVGVYSNRQLFGIDLAAMIIMLRALPRHRPDVFWTVILVIASSAMVYVQMRHAAMVRRQFESIEAVAAKAGGGTVAYDRTRVSLNPWLCEFRWYEDLVGTGYADTHHPLQKLLRKRHPQMKYVKIKPLLLRDGWPATDTVVNYAPGHFAVTVGDTEHTRILLHRRNALTGSEMPVDTLPYARAVLIHENLRAFLVTPSQPFVEIYAVSLYYGKKRVKNAAVIN